MNTLVVYYSHTGNNAYLARKLATDLQADIEPIRPRLNVFGFLLISSWLGISFGVRKLKHVVGNYDLIVLTGPIWTGQLISPLRCFLKQNKKSIRQLFFITNCGGSDAIRDDKFGYNQVFAKVHALLGARVKGCAALPIPLIVPEEHPEQGVTVMKTRLSDINFKSPMTERYQQILSDIGVRSMTSV